MIRPGVAQHLCGAFYFSTKPMTMIMGFLFLNRETERENQPGKLS
jgi:hypothetical protein